MGNTCQMCKIFSNNSDTSQSPLIIINGKVIND